MIAFYSSLTDLINVILGRLSYYASYIDSYPILYMVGLLAIVLSAVSILSHLSKI